MTDAYCKVSLGRYEYQTPIVSGSLEPKFMVLYDFPIEMKEEQDEKDKRVLIECFDSEKISQHTLHGSFTFDKSRWLPNETVSGWFHFTVPNFSPDGQLDVSFTYYPDMK